MKFCHHVHLVGQIASTESIGEAARLTEQLGLDSVWTSDHVVIPAQIGSKYPGTATGRFTVKGSRDFYEPLAVMAYLAGVTERVRIGVSVLVVPYRNPVVTAKQLASIDALAKGRLIVGVGVGWMPEEFAALHAPPFEARGAATDEYLEIFRKLWTGEVVRHDGKYYQFEEIQSNPRPANPDGIPIWVGGYSRPAYRRVARLGNGWHGIGFTPDRIGEPIAEIRRQAEAVGRDPTEITISTRLALDPSEVPLADRSSDDRGRSLAGTVDEIVGQIHGYELAGVDTIVLTFAARTVDDFRRCAEFFGRRILPRLT